ncbi:CLUMA_CG017632, isoform A [Clunio marinus]|uniref:CLUMA_CG017632, isoform A n=1 Tax=Clunio marinus TaxID=568069 RepID=A0A1J1J130_9DIPT|nr:CLUMA_CG017632, isoform A [Clunio marinus]
MLRYLCIYGVENMSKIKLNSHMEFTKDKFAKNQVIKKSLVTTGKCKYKKWFTKLKRFRKGKLVLTRYIHCVCL